ncbi:multidrug resistance-associated protein 1 [Halyomorpha halys]|uniref:multidrug resistance-associated protein 1 n=1 Tax=Halyomorpha halys TaxID=286706 RepID=UPI0006D4F34C|nr:multidrug resistance-associated protein 1-like [Halyomorpha halys]XP_024216145.1 multidrug resistance-associated protein 1-like [Halyomorpha halys]XP_024216146.1 multidrug resistance-associated protein 1-like [Halyomorpha halys]
MDTVSSQNFCGSPFWDTNLTWNTESPRLTRCLEKTVFWIPCFFLWTFFCIDVFYICTSKSRNIPWNWRNILKLVCLGLLLALSAFEFQYIDRSETVYPVDTYSSLLRAISLALCITLVIFHRKHGQRTSGLFFLFWFLVLFLEFSQFYTSITGHISNEETDAMRIVNIASYCLYFLMFLLCCISDLPPKQSEYPTLENSNPEDGVSYPSRLFLFWFDSLVYKGLKRPLVQNDLWQMKYEDAAAQIFNHLNRFWLTELRNKNKDVDKKSNSSEEINGILENQNEIKPKKQASIFFPLCKAFGWPYMFATFLHLIEVLLVFVSPELLEYIINFVSSDEPMWHGYFYAVMMLLIGIVLPLIRSYHNMTIMTVGLRTRTALISTIYRKSLNLSNAARKETTMGEIVNLMSVDSQSLMHSLIFINYLFFGPIEIGLALFFLWQQLGPSVLASLAVMLVMIPVNSFIAKKSKVQQQEQMKIKDERVKMMNEVLSGMKVLKLYAWEPSFIDRILKIKDKETKILKKKTYFRAATSCLSSCVPFLVTILAFAVYVLIDENNILDSSKIFVSVSLFNIMRSPLLLIPSLIPSAIQAVVSIKRINKFLNSEDLDMNTVTHDTEDDEPLVMEKCTFSWGGEETPTLHNLDLKIKPGSLVAVVGAVGSGKSSLISAFLGEMEKMSGRVNTRGTIAYVPQIAWIQNCSLQDNILFGKNLDSRKYHKVIDACALKRDLEMLPGGDLTEIGEKGINVSGGQKQRISLARAVYADCDLYFLDDPLSAVDSHVGKHIFENIIGPNGLLCEKTRLLVTHSITFLPETDMIVVLKDGSVSEIGTYRELLAKKGAFSEFLVSHLKEINNEELEVLDDSIMEVLNTDPELQRQISDQNNSTTSLSSARKRRISELSEKSTTDKSTEPPGKKLIEEEKVEVGRIQWRIYANYFKAIGNILWMTSIALIVVNQALDNGSYILLSKWSDDKDSVINGTQNMGKTKMYLELYGLLGFGGTFVNLFSSLTWYIGAVNAGAMLHSLLLKNIMHSPMSFFDTTPQGRILNRFSKDIDVLDNTIPYMLKQTFVALAPLLGTIFVISYSTPYFLIVIIPMGFVYYLIQKCYIATSQQLQRIESITVSPIYSHFSESISGSSVIRAYCAQKRFIEESNVKVDINQSSSYAIIVAEKWLGIRLQLIGGLICFFASLFAVIGKDYLSPGIVGLSISYTLEITNLLHLLVVLVAEVESGVIALERIEEYSNTPQEAAWYNSSPVGDDWPKEGKVELVNYSVRYREGLDLVLNMINLSTKANEKIGIVGRTGAGKSSVTLSLFRIIEAADGKILIDGVDVSTLGLQFLRSRLTIIPQDPVLFSGSLRMNLDPFGIYNDEQIWKALELSHLKAFVQELPAALQHEVSEGGENLSVGQRQLICLARALLRKTKILILDEATAAVDLETDDFIQRTIRSEFADCTVLTIAHRLNTIMDSDRVLVLDQGRIVEFDVPAILLKNKSSIFYSLAQDAGLA